MLIRQTGLLSSAAMLVTVLPQATWAKDAATNEAQVPATGVLQEVLVTAQRREESQQDVPISMTALTADAITRANVDSTTDLPRLAPSLTFSQGYFPGASTFNIRGIGSYVYRIGVQPAVSAVIDGIPLARNGDFVADLGDLERIEILNGPQGTLFGRNTTGGVVNISRKRPSHEYEGFAEARVSQGRLDDTGTLLRGGVNVPVGERAAGRLFAFRRENDDYIENLHPTASDEGGLRSWGASAMFEVDITDALNVLFSADYAKSHVDAGAPQVLIPLQSYQAPTIPNVSETQIAMQSGAVGQRFKANEWDPWFTRQELGAVTGDVTWDMSDSWRMKSLTSYRDNHIESTPSFYPVSASVFDTQGWDWLSGTRSSQNPNDTPRDTQYQYLSHETRFEFTSEAFDLTTGIYVLDLTEEETSELPRYRSARSLGSAFVARVGTATGPAADFPYYYSDTMSQASNDNTVFAGFVDGTLHVTDRVDVYAGYRYAREKLDYEFTRFSWNNVPVQMGTNFSSLLPSTTTVAPDVLSFAGDHSEGGWAARTGVRWAVSDDINLYASVNRAYVGAGVDLSNGTAGTASNPGGALLKPSTSVNYEIGSKMELLEHRLRLNLAVFQMKTEDVQVTALIPGTNINQVRNAGNIESHGLEGTFDIFMGERFKVNGGFAWQHTEFQELTQLCYPGQSAAQGCNGASQIIDGMPALNAPDLKASLGASYDLPLAEVPFDMVLRSQYVWQDKVFYQLDHDPLAVQDAYGLLNVSVDFIDDDGRYEASLFATNVTDEYYCANMVSGPTARQSCQFSPLDAQARYGLKLRVAF